MVNIQMSPSMIDNSHSDELEQTLESPISKKHISISECHSNRDLKDCHMKTESTDEVTNYSKSYSKSFDSGMANYGTLVPTPSLVRIQIRGQKDMEEIGITCTSWKSMKMMTN